MLRAILSAVAGCVLAVGVIFVIEAMGQALFPLPAGVDLKNPEHLRTLVDRMSPLAQTFILGAWLTGAAAGGLFANVLARRRWPALAVGAWVAIGAIMNMAMIPHPLWMQLAGVFGPLAVGWLIYRAGRPAALG